MSTGHLCALSNANSRVIKKEIMLMFYLFQILITSKTTLISMSDIISRLTNNLAVSRESHGTSKTEKRKKGRERTLNCDISYLHVITVSALSGYLKICLNTKQMFLLTLPLPNANLTKVSKSKKKMSNENLKVRPLKRKLCMGPLMVLFVLRCSLFSRRFCLY